MYLGTTHDDTPRHLLEWLQVADLEQSKTSLEQDMASLTARIAAASSAGQTRMSSKAAATAGVGGRPGRKSGRAAAAAAAASFPPEVVPLPIAPPVIPAHFVPYTFKYPGREPFTVRPPNSCLRFLT